jgi:hypothetical protein
LRDTFKCTPHLEARDVLVRVQYGRVFVADGAAVDEDLRDVRIVQIAAGVRGALGVLGANLAEEQQQTSDQKVATSDGFLEIF